MIGRRARRYRRPVLIPAPFSENSISLPLRAAGRRKKSEKTGKKRGGGRERRKREGKEGGGEREKPGYVIADNAGRIRVRVLPLPPPSPPLFLRIGQKVICQLIHAYRAWLFAMNTHGGGGEKARWPFNAVALR